MQGDLHSLLKISLDELRMQMLGTQVAFGFQFQSLFQDRFDVSDPARRAMGLAGLICMLLTLALLIAAPAVHRIADFGEATERTQRLTASFAHVALITLALGITAAVFVTFVIGYALTESRVMLPGAQALLGFQLLVPLTKSFESLPDAARTVHFLALVLVAMTVVLLIAPAAIHRIAFDGADDPRFLRLASRLVTAALIPLALGIASELYVAGVRLLPGSPNVVWIAAAAARVLIGFWYALPLGLRDSSNAR